MQASHKLRLVVMGTGPFAVPMFRALLASSHEIIALATRPDRPVHGKQSAPQNLMRDLAREHGLEVFEPPDINSGYAVDRLRRWTPELLVVCDYGQILSPQALETARLGGVNLHGSLLPRYRGAAPIQWAIYHGETESGVTVIQMTQGLDAGPALVQKRLAIDPDETAAQLEPRLSELGVGAVVEAIELLQTGQSGGIPQDSAQATKAPRLKKTDGAIDWNRTASEIRNQFRAFEPWPKTYTFWRSGDGAPMRLILEQVTVEAAPEVAERSAQPPGTVLIADGPSLVIACGVDALSIQRLQPAGKRSMAVEEFLRGQRVKAGDHFADEPSQDPT